MPYNKTVRKTNQFKKFQNIRNIPIDSNNYITELKKLQLKYLHTSILIYIFKYGTRLDKKNSQHVQTQCTLVYKLPARAGTDLGFMNLV